MYKCTCIYEIEKFPARVFFHGRCAILTEGSYLIDRIDAIWVCIKYVVSHVCNTIAMTVAYVT